MPRPRSSVWGSVRRGEDKYIFPYQENADVMFNSSLFYEISVLRQYVEPMLREVPDVVPEYAEARRLLKFLDNFTQIPSDEIPSHIDIAGVHRRQQFQVLKRENRDLRPAA